MPESRLLAPIDERLARKRFARAAARGIDDPFAREIDQRMQERLDYVQISPETILDLGAGAGYSAEGLMHRYPDAQLLQLDAVPGLLPKPHPGRSSNKWLRFLRPPEPPIRKFSICSDASRLPVATSSQGLIWANMLLPWVSDISSVISETQRALKPNGLLMFSTLGPSTLQTLDELFFDNNPHRHTYPDMHDLGDLLGKTGFSDPVMDMEMLHVEYQSLTNLVKDLRNACALNAHTSKRSGLLGKEASRHLNDAWQRKAELSSPPGTVRISFEIVYGHAWKSAMNTLGDGRSIIRFDPKTRGITRSNTIL